MTREQAAVDAVAPFLSCPVCRSSLTRMGSSLRCESAHSFDIARQGYVSLFDGGRRANTGDDAAMVEARDRFLGHGHYAPIAAAVRDVVRDLPSRRRGLLADLAGGTGYYLAEVLADGRRSPGVSIDLSVPASRRAAKAHPDVAALAADVWGRLPLADGSCSVVLSIFGPRNGPEIHRVLHDDGHLVVVSPAADHLHELVQRLGLIGVDPHKRERLDRRLAGLARRSTLAVRYQIDATLEDIADEVAMGPSSHHLDAASMADRLAAMPTPLSVTVAVEVSVWTKADEQPEGVAGSHNGSA